MLSALVLEAKVNPELLGDEVVRNIVGRVFDALLLVPPGSSKKKT
jgi:hypothetical protein